MESVSSPNMSFAPIRLLRPVRRSELTGCVIGGYLCALLVTDDGFRSDCWNFLTSSIVPWLVPNLLLLGLLWPMGVCLVVTAVSLVILPYSRHPNLRGNREVIETLAIVTNLVSAAAVLVHLYDGGLHWWHLVLPALNVVLALHEFFATGADPDVDEQEMRPRHGLIGLVYTAMAFYVLEHYLDRHWSESLSAACVCAAGFNLVLPVFLPLAPKWTRYAHAGISTRIGLKHMVEAERRDDLARQENVSNTPTGATVAPQDP